MYHGKQRGVDPKQLSRYACVLTTYTTMGMEAASKEDLKQGNSISQPVQLPDSDDEDNTAAFPGDILLNQTESMHTMLLDVACIYSMCTPCVHSVAITDPPTWVAVTRKIAQRVIRRSVYTGGRLAANFHGANLHGA